MKLLPAKTILMRAYDEQKISKHTIVVDTSSGTFALGMGLVCAELGLSFQIFGDPAIDAALVQQLELLGGKVHISRDPKNPGAYQALRLQALHQFMAQHPQSFWMNQYDNGDAIAAYATVGELFMEALGAAELSVVGAVGSGSSTCGIIKKIRDYNAAAELIGVDTFNSVLFGQPDGQRWLRGLGNSIMPKNLVHCYFDQIHWVCAEDAFYYTKYLYTTRGLYGGATTGACYQVASYLARNHPHKKYIFIAADEGHRYSATVYNNAWLKQNNLYSEIPTVAPKKVMSPEEAQFPWGYMDWKRQSYQNLNCRRPLAKAEV